MREESYRRADSAEQGDLFFTIATGVLVAGIAALIYNDYPVVAVGLLVFVTAFFGLRAVYELLRIIEKLRDLRQGRGKDAK